MLIVGLSTVVSLYYTSYTLQTNITYTNCFLLFYFRSAPVIYIPNIMWCLRVIRT